MAKPFRLAPSRHTDFVEPHTEIRGVAADDDHAVRCRREQASDATEPTAMRMRRYTRRTRQVTTVTTPDRHAHATEPRDASEACSAVLLV